MLGIENQTSGHVKVQHCSTNQNTQHVAIAWPNAQHSAPNNVALCCCYHLAGALHLSNSCLSRKNAITAFPYSLLEALLIKLHVLILDAKNP